MIEPTGSQRDAASTLFNLSDYRVINALDLPDGGRRVEVCGETRPAQIGTTLGRPRVKVLGETDLPVARQTSLKEWSKGQVDWEWISVEGLAHAVTADRFGVKTLHMTVDGRRVRVKIDLTSGHPSISNLVGAKVRASGIASQSLVMWAVAA